MQKKKAFFFERESTNACVVICSTKSKCLENFKSYNYTVAVVAAALKLKEGKPIVEL